MNKFEFSQALVGLRLQNNLTIKELSKLINYSKSYIAHLEAGSSKISIIALHKYAKLFSIPMRILDTLKNQSLTEIRSYLFVNRYLGIGQLHADKNIDICLAYSNDVEPLHIDGSYEDLQPDYSRVLKGLRQSNKTIIGTLSKHTGMNMNNILKYESGREPISVKDINKYSDYFNIDRDVLHIYVDRYSKLKIEDVSIIKEQLDEIIKELNLYYKEIETKI